MKRLDKQLFWLLIFLLLALIVSTFILGSVPPVDRDGLTHHLYVPKLWLQHGGIFEIPEIPFSYYPMNLDLLYTLPLAFGNDIIPKYIHYLFALLTALLLYQHLDKRLGRAYGIFGALFFLSVPIIVKLSITVYVDLGLVFFTTASLLLLLHWARQQFPIKILIMAGLSCGLAAGTKYNGLVSIVVLTLLVPVIFQRNCQREHRSNLQALFSAFLFLLASLIAFSPWLVRNYTWTGNPIYPLHKSFFQQNYKEGINAPQQEKNITNQIKNLSNKAASPFIGRKILYGETWWQALLLPIRFFFEGQDDNPRYFDGKLTPFLLILPFLIYIFRPPNKQEQNILLWFSLLYFFFTFFQESMRIRYIVPIVPPLTILACYGFHSFIQRLQQLSFPKRIRTTVVNSCIVCLSLFVLGYNVLYLSRQFSIIQPLSYVFGKTSRDQYIATFRPEYPAIQFANHTIKNDAKVLCLFFGNRGYYMNFRPIFEQPYKSSSLLGQYLNLTADQQTILDQMRQHHITHILARVDLTTQWLQQLPKSGQQSLAPLFANASQPLFDAQGYIFFNIPQTIP
nr:phospholipid carrier-dependent glycosyltransferase [uncultured Desulfobulbus sp.]